MAKMYTKYRLTNSMLKAMSAMNNKKYPHRYGTMLGALERRGEPNVQLIVERPALCPKCWGSMQSTVRYNDNHYESGADVLWCHAGHSAKRRDWGGCYGFSRELTQAGRDALAAARAEGW